MVIARSQLEALIPAGDAKYDVIVCGSGMAGLDAAAAAALAAKNNVPPRQVSAKAIQAVLAQMGVKP